MTVIRGDAARALVARSRHVQHDAGRRSAARTGTTDLTSGDGVGAAVEHAERFVRGLLAGTDQARRADKAAVVAAELVANALDAAPAATLRVQATDSGTLLIEVWDAAPADRRLLAAATSPRPTVDPTSHPGRGLDVVGLLAPRWGVRHDTAGTCVWALLEHDPT